MSGLKSGSGDDLWDDEEKDDVERDGDGDGQDQTESTEDSESRPETDRGRSNDSEGSRAESDAGEGSGSDHPYIVRRAIQDKSVQFERDERLTFFVHDDVAKGERELRTEMESALGRDIPKFDVREAVYRAALRNPDEVMEELVEMGYSRSD